MTKAKHLSLSLAAAALSASTGHVWAQTNTETTTEVRVDVLRPTNCAAICNAQFDCLRWSFAPATWKKPQSVCTLVKGESRPTFNFGPNSTSELTVTSLMNNRSTLPPPQVTPAAPILPETRSESILRQTELQDEQIKQRGGFGNFVKRLNPFGGSSKDNAEPELAGEADLAAVQEVAAKSNIAPEIVQIEPPVIPVAPPEDAQVTIEDPLPETGPRVEAVSEVSVEVAPVVVAEPVVEVAPVVIAEPVVEVEPFDPISTETANVEPAKETAIASEPELAAPAPAPAPPQAPIQTASTTPEPQPKKRQLRTLRQRYSVQRDAQRTYEQENKEREE